MPSCTLVLTPKPMKAITLLSALFFAYIVKQMMEQPDKNESQQVLMAILCAFVLGLGLLFTYLVVFNKRLK